jgi:hypothetical protein
VRCPNCGLDSYAVTPHSAVSLCPYCDAELFPAGGGSGATGEDDTGERDTEAA